MQFTDSASVAGTRLTDEGYLVADAHCVRTGVQHYLACEIGLVGDGLVAVYRPESEVFHRDSLASFSHVPVTIDHPPAPVTPETWKDVAVGETGDEVLRDGERLRIPLIVKDAAAIAAIQAGKRDLSAGYTCTIDYTPGIAPDGTPYAAVQRGIRANHLAVVAQGRAGNTRIGDGARNWGAAPIHDADNTEVSMTLRKIMVDGLQVETTDAGAQAIEKLQGEIKAKDAQIAADAKIHADDLAAKDEEIGALKADLKAAQDAAKIDVDKLVADRAALVEVVKALDDSIDVTGKTDSDLRKAAVAAKLGDAMVADASEAEITGMFKAIAKDNKPVDAVADALRRGVKTSDGAKMVADAQSAYVARLTRQKQEA